LQRHSDRVASASITQLVNEIAPIMTDHGGEAWRKTTLHPFSLPSLHARHEVLDVRLDAPTFTHTRYGESSAADAVATWDEQDGALSVFVVNRGNTDELALDADLASFGDLELVEAVTLHHEDPYAANTKDAPDTVAPQANDTVRLEGGRLVGTRPAISWSQVRRARPTA